MASRVEPGLPYPLGVTLRGDGINVALPSETAERVELCLFDSSGAETRVELPERSGHVFHGYLPGIGAGQRYGFRVHGAWDPTRGLRHNPHKLLLDPWARAVEGTFGAGEEVFGHHWDDGSKLNEADSAPSVPRCVVVDESFDWGNDTPPRTPLHSTLVYETHVKGLTYQHPDVPEELRGTYAGLAHPAVTNYLKDLGVTTVELLPMHQFVQDSHLEEKGLRNYWGYNSIGFLAPHGEYAAAGDGGGQVAEFKQMVKDLHAAGLEVVLDVVYNHTAEGNDKGPTFSLKGIDNGSFYRLVEGDEAHYFDTSGTGNSINASHPVALGLVMDSLRYWVQEMHVDGFRFDLATTLTRQGGEMDVHSAFLTLVHQDPVLAPVKMIAEPWDTAGYQVGGFPARWSEWNGKYRDDVRDFWRGEEGVLGAFAHRITGSGDIYGGAPGTGARDPLCSINFITAHDGFTLHDLTSYDAKHNDANGEGNNDGENDNKSWGCGAEGPTDDDAVNELRRRQRKNFLATLLLSHGVPMLLGGDEMGRTQGGNNNAYCQDSEISWFDWSGVDDDGEELRAFTRELTELRREHPALRPRHFGDVDVEMRRADGPEMSDADWAEPLNKALTVHFTGPRSDGADDVEEFMLMVNGSESVVEFTVPTRTDSGTEPEAAGLPGWKLVLSTDPDQHVKKRGLAPGQQILVRDRSLTLLHRID
ncbi:glycogen debranching protein GlgX [Quadrisphaera granulorum]|uniref:glycogen debranching protein GlgX n=1 Tax=Quadrisphaera granulorum TaxID=317664 RepID=UPI000D6C5146